jgi:CBS domain-containing protein
MELARNLRTDSVSSLQAAAPLTIQPHQPVADAVALMRKHQVGCVLVCTRGQLVGIFTERDLVRRVLGAQLPLSVPVAECMTPDPVVVEPKAPIRSAVCLMQKGGYRHLPVVDEA